MKSVTVLIAGVLCLACPAGAGTPDAPPVPPDPATLTMPSLPLAFTDKDLRSSDDRYYYYKPGASYQAVFSDIFLCRAYAGTVVQFAKAKDYAPLGTSAPADTSGRDLRWPLPYGLVGAWIGNYLSAQFAEIDVRRCMSYRGYKRYAVSREAYRQISAGSDTDMVARLALAASGPAPLGGEVGP